MWPNWNGPCRGVVLIERTRDGNGGILAARNSGKLVFRRMAPTSSTLEVGVGNKIIPAPDGRPGRVHGAMATYGGIKHLIEVKIQVFSLHIAHRTNYEPDSQNFPGFSYEPRGRVAYQA